MRVIGFLVALIPLFFNSASAKENWTYFSIPNSDFVVSLPGNPTLVKDTTDARGVVSKVYISELANGVAFVVDYSIQPRSVVADTVTADQFIDHAVTNGLPKDFKVVSDRRFKFGNASATEFVAVKDGENSGIVKIRIYARRDDAGSMRAYQCTVGGPPNSQNSPDAIRFLESFKFVPK